MGNFMAAHDITTALARTTQALRAERGWSLDQLAARSGVSKGVLVAVEQGRSNPNLATLARISDAFGVPVTRLVEVASETGVQISGAADSRVLWHGRRRDGHHHPRHRPALGGRVLALDGASRRRLGRRRASPGHRELAWVESGTLTLTVAGTRYQVSAGQCARVLRRPAALLPQRRHGPLVLTTTVVVPPAPG